MALRAVREDATIRVLPNGRVSRTHAAVMIGCSTKTLANWKCLGTGPRCIQVGGRAFYDFKEVEVFANGGEAPSDAA